jgi:hypothetical protein
MNTRNIDIAKTAGDVFGYNAAFEEAIAKIGQISRQEFAQRYAGKRVEYIPQISWNPTTAKFWDDFNLDVSDINNPNRKIWRSHDFRLNASELEIFKKNGFVVSERLGGQSFAELFYRIYNNNLPVFVSTDALLHAWHRSYDAILAELEETYLSQTLDKILEGMAQKIPDAWNQYGNGVLSESIKDADYFLAVARSLLGSKQLPEEQITYFFEVPEGKSPENPRDWICPDITKDWVLSADREVQDQFSLQERNQGRQFWFSTSEAFALRSFTGELTVEQVQELCRQKLRKSISPTFVENLLKKLANLEILGLHNKVVKTKLNQDNRVINTLKAIAEKQTQKVQLFGSDRTLDFSEFKVRGHYQNSQLLKRYFRSIIWCGCVDLRIDSPQEVGAALVLYNLIKKSGKFEQWQQFNQLIQTFLGRTYSLNFAQLGDILEKCNIKSPDDIKDVSTLEQLRNEILANKISPDSYQLQVAELPRSFTIFGQRFALDNWAISKVVYDEILWDGEKIPRRIPTSLDVAFAVLGSDQVVSELVDRMTDIKGPEFRDGLDYQHNLAAVRDAIDAQNPAWEENIYMNWLATLRGLSAPIANIPEEKDTPKEIKDTPKETTVDKKNWLSSLGDISVNLPDLSKLTEKKDTPKEAGTGSMDWFSSLRDISINLPDLSKLTEKIDTPKVSGIGIGNVDWLSNLRDLSVNLPDLGKIIENKDNQEGITIGVGNNQVFLPLPSEIIRFIQEKRFPQYPEAMCTRAWAMKTVNTQLASWMQLRHDAIVDTKQASTSGIPRCYPEGFVEPQPGFWERFEKMALLAANAIEKNTFPNRTVEKFDKWGRLYEVQLKEIQKKQIDFLKSFAQTLAILKEISLKELLRQKLNEEEIKFLGNIVEESDRSIGKPTYSGWYPSLFYKEAKDSEQWDAIVTDVHTDLADPIQENQGCVVYQGIGNVDLLTIAVDNGEDKTIYAGPVMSHYEFTLPGVEPKTDLSWQEDIENGNIPPRPEWTKSYLVSGEVK